jgi:hypothetical protein
MKGLPSRSNTQIFVAGALALMGVEALISLPRHFAAQGFAGLIVSCILASTLPLGLGIFLESTVALRLTKVYLSLFVGLGCLLLSCIGILRAQHFETRFAEALFLPSVRTLLLSGILLLLLLWGSRPASHLTNRSSQPRPGV